MGLSGAALVNSAAFSVSFLAAELFFETNKNFFLEKASCVNLIDAELLWLKAEMKGCMSPTPVFSEPRGFPGTWLVHLG